MRFKAEHDPPEGTIRLKKCFLFLPKYLNGETRWLERATIQQEGIYYQDTSILFWDDIAWIDN